ncbi:MAG: 50S ribosomal protein L19 [bacterium]|nr:50S ribosomal protein L19 [bacterium]
MNAITVSPVDMTERAELGIRAGDTVRVWQKIEEKGKTRLQAFEGLVLARKHGNEAGGTFTVRKVSGGIGVEKIFPLYSPVIDKVEIVKRAKVRRAKLYFIRDKVARELKRVLRRTSEMSVATKGSAELEEERKRAEAEEAERVAAEEKRADKESARDAQAAQNDADQMQNDADNEGAPTESEEKAEEKPKEEEKKSE